MVGSHKYCQEHLTVVAEEFTRGQITTILSEHLGVDRSRIQRTSEIIEDLDADSLDTVELVMALEEAFGCEISDDVAQKIISVEDAVRAVMAQADFTKVNYETGGRRYRDELYATTRQLEIIVNSNWFLTFLQAFSIPASQFKELLIGHIYDKKVEYVTTVPESDSTDTLVKAHVIFLTKTTLYYYLLQRDRIVFSSEKLSRINITTQLNYHKDALVEIHVSGRSVYREDDDLRFRFSFGEPYGMKRAQTFLNKFTKFREQL